ncbi:MAG: choice-of-anchor J domain-containing protein [Bacteroidaceae bacterium]|nr:choice-of-anchor J domain-containing protein [Bacteroidaceae bacterium]
MKKLLSLVCVAVMMVFTACEDVPAPYIIHSEGGSTIFSESFASSLGKFKSKSASGNLSWYCDYSSAIVTGYKDFNGDGTKENQSGETYLVSPVIHLENVDSAYISFSQAIKFEKSTIQTDHKLLISSNYAGDVSAATWTELPMAYDGLGGSGDFTFVDQKIQIPQEFMGKSIVIALKHIAYESYSSTWEVKNLKVMKGTVETTPEPTPQPTEEYTLPFTNYSLNEGFTVVTEKGIAWSLGKTYAKASGYANNSTSATVSWLISPAINTTKAEGNDDAVVVDFDYVLRYVVAGTDPAAFHKLYATTDFDGDVKTATWIDLGFQPVESSTKDWTFYSAPTLTLPEQLVGQEKVWFAFRFECNAQNSTTWELQNFKVHQAGNNDPDNPDNPDNPDIPEPSGDNLIANGTCEAWNGNTPIYWVSTTKASSATISQSEDHHSGSYSIKIAGDPKANKRLAYKEITLKAGTYNFKFYAKAATSSVASVRPGYVPVKEGKVGDYVYGDYVNNITNSEWVEVNHSFKLTGETTINLVVMNPKGTGTDVLFDDAELTTTDGGLVTGGDDNGGDDNGGDDNGGDDNTSSLPYSINFTSSIEGWTTNDVNLNGLNFVWKQDNTYGMKASAYYNKTNYAAESDFISPEFTIPATGATLSLSHALNHLNNNPRADFVSVQAVLATGGREEITLSAWPAGKDFNYIDATANLEAYAGQTIKIALHYKSSSACAPTWEIKTLSIK